MNKSSTDLTLKVGETAEQQATKELGTSGDSSTDLVWSLFDNHELVAEVIACVVNFDACVAFETAAGRARRDDLAQTIRVHLERFRSRQMGVFWNP